MNIYFQELHSILNEPTDSFGGDIPSEDERYINSDTKTFSICVQTDNVKTKSQASQYRDPFSVLKNKVIQVNLDMKDATTQTTFHNPLKKNLAFASTQTEDVFDTETDSECDSESIDCK